MLTKKIGIPAMALALCGALLSSGCLEQAAAPAEGEGTLVVDTSDAATPQAGVSDIGIAATSSFFSSCTGGWAWHEGDINGPIYSAGADRCRRRNGTYTTNPTWTGYCTTDIANCDGRLLCTRSCP